MQDLSLIQSLRDSPVFPCVLLYMFRCTFICSIMKSEHMQRDLSVTVTEFSFICTFSMMAQLGRSLSENWKLRWYTFIIAKLTKVCISNNKLIIFNRGRSGICCANYCTINIKYVTSDKIGRNYTVCKETYKLPLTLSWSLY